MTTSERIIVSGDVCGNFDVLYKRVSSIIKKRGDFSMLLCTGSFFSKDASAAWEAYKSGKKKVPVQTFILGPNSNEETAYFTHRHMCDLVDNVAYLGKVGIFSTSAGVKIAFLSGMENSKRSGICYDKSDITKLIALCRCETEGYLGIDVLMTSQWPTDISVEKNPKRGARLLSILIQKIKPRYIFCGTEGIWFERVPYKNDSDEEYSTITRFVALGKVGGTEKWIYAVDIKTMSDSKLNRHQLLSYEPSPFKNVSLLELEEKACQFFFSEPPAKKAKKKMGQSSEFKTDSPCWFCLSSPQVEKHLIVTIGEEAYLTLPKGWLVENHFIITPIGHYKSSAEAPNSVLKEINKFKAAISMYYEKLDCRPIFYERNYRTIHLQINALPIPEKKCNILEVSFKKLADKMSLDLKVLDKSDFSFPKDKDYFIAELPSGTYLHIDIENRFPLRFDREVLSQPELLNVPDRINWDACKATMEEEKNLAETARSSFKPFDFT